MRILLSSTIFTTFGYLRLSSAPPFVVTLTTSTHMGYGEYTDQTGLTPASCNSATSPTARRPRERRKCTSRALAENFSAASAN